MPSWLLWLAPVLVATPAAALWAAWSSRARPPAQPQESVAAYERFRRALAVPDDRDGPADR